MTALYNQRSFELHLDTSPDLPKRYGARIKAIGGSYSECRGHSYKRFVNLPATRAGRTLANELLADFPHRVRPLPGSTVIFRRWPRVGNVVADNCSNMDLAFLSLVDRARYLRSKGHLRTPATAIVRAETKLAKARERVELARQSVERAHAELAAAETELAALERP